MYGRESERMLTVKEIAARFATSEKTVRSWIARGCPAFVLNPMSQKKRWRLKMAEVRRWLEREELEYGVDRQEVEIGAKKQ